jgi:hypothetical protein
MTFKKLATRFALITFVAALPNISSAAVPHTFAAGDPIRASEVNANNSDLDQRQTAVETRATVLETGDTASDTRLTAVEGRATTLESGATANDTRLTTVEDRTTALESSVASQNVAIDINCTADADAFINTTIADSTTYTLSGICNGPIELSKKRNVVITGNDVTGAKTDGIFLPGGLTTNPYAALAVWESSAEIRHLTIDATNYVTDGAGYLWPNPGALDGTVSVGQMAILRIYDVDIKGGDYALNVYRQSYAKAYSNVNITGFNLTGVSASNAAHVELSQPITVIGLLSGSTNPSAGAVYAGSNSHVQIKNGGTFTAPVHASPEYPYSLAANENGSIKVKDGATSANFTSQMSAYYGGLIRINGNATIAATDEDNEAISAGSGGIIRVKNSSITGGVWSGENSTVRFESSSQSGGYVQIARNGTLRTTGASSIDTTGFNFSGSTGANIGLRDTTSVAGSPLNLSQYATVYIRDTVSFGGVGITCQSQVNQVSFGANTTIGDLFGCPLNP